MEYKDYFGENTENTALEKAYNNALSTVYQDKYDEEKKLDNLIEILSELQFYSRKLDKEYSLHGLKKINNITNIEDMIVDFGKNLISLSDEGKYSIDRYFYMITYLICKAGKLISGILNSNTSSVKAYSRILSSILDVLDEIVENKLKNS